MLAELPDWVQPSSLPSFTVKEVGHLGCNHFGLFCEAVLLSRDQLEQLLAVGTGDLDRPVLQLRSSGTNGFPNPGSFEDLLNWSDRAQVFECQPKKVGIGDHGQEKRFNISRQTVGQRLRFSALAKSFHLCKTRPIARQLSAVPGRHLRLGAAIKILDQGSGIFARLAHHIPESQCVHHSDRQTPPRGRIRTCPGVGYGDKTGGDRFAI